MSNNQYPEFVPVETNWNPDTVTVQAGRPSKVVGAPMNTPIALSSTYVHTTDLGYGRDGNLSWGALEEALGQLDGGIATTFSSGLSAATAITDLIPPGGTLVVPTSAYYGVKNIFARSESHERLTVRLIDEDNTEATIAALEGADAVWMESISNPTLVVSDIPVIVKAAKKRSILTIVDSTFATPLRQRPLDFGADIVLQSVTKYLGGHSDLLLGAVICKSNPHAQFMAKHRHDFGAIPGALDAYLALRGLRTLAVRLDRSESNALELAKCLKNHPKIKKVNYPALPNDSQQEKAKRVLPNGCGGMLSFEIDTTPERTDQILESLKVITHATSLGGVESLIERRTRYEAEREAGVPMTLCRFSVGIENVEDLWSDLESSISKVLD